MWERRHTHRIVQADSRLAASQRQSAWIVGPSKSRLFMQMVCTAVHVYVSWLCRLSMSCPEGGADCGAYRSMFVAIIYTSTTLVQLYL